MTTPLEDWYQVTFDDQSIYLDIRPNEEAARGTTIQWADIIRVCFKPGNYIVSDEIYIFISERAESYLIPVEASGGNELWMEIIGRNLFDAQLAIDVASKIDGVYCWPKE